MVVRPSIRQGGTIVALAASVALLALPSVERKAPAVPVTAAQAWPGAQRVALEPGLKDGSSYDPAFFLDAGTSVGSALNGKVLRLVVRHPDGSVRRIRELPQKQYPSFPAVAVAGDTLVWVERDNRTPASLWTAGLKSGPPRRLTTDVGDIQSDSSENDLLIADGKVHWVVSGPMGTTVVRSIALSGGPVGSQSVDGDWKLSAWPWLANGVTASAGTTQLRNLLTGEVRAMPVAGRGETQCDPVWCRVTRLDAKGTAIDLMKADGSESRRIGDETMAAVLTDPAPLGEFTILGKIDQNAQLTNHVQLVAYEIATRRSVVISPDAFDVGYRAGVIWWSAGNDNDFVRHAFDLRTVGDAPQ